MLRNILYVTLAAIAGALTLGLVFLVFLVFAFVNWSMDPGRWTSDARFLCALLGFCGFVFVFTISSAAMFEWYKKQREARSVSSSW